MRCQHKQRQTGKHTKSIKMYNNTGCPAQIIVTLLPPKTHDGFCVVIHLKHTHNHLTNIADALRQFLKDKNTITYSDKVILHLVPTFSMKQDPFWLNEFRFKV